METRELHRTHRGRDERRRTPTTDDGSLITSAKKVMFLPPVCCFSIGWLVCLSAGLHKKLLNGFSWNLVKLWNTGQKRTHSIPAQFLKKASEFSSLYLTLRDMTFFWHVSPIFPGIMHQWILMKRIRLFSRTNIFWACSIWCGLIGFKGTVGP